MVTAFIVGTQDTWCNLSVFVTSARTRTLDKDVKAACTCKLT